MILAWMSQGVGVSVLCRYSDGGGMFDTELHDGNSGHYTIRV